MKATPRQHSKLKSKVKLFIAEDLQKGMPALKNAPLPDLPKPIEKEECQPEEPTISESQPESKPSDS